MKKPEIEIITIGKPDINALYKTQADIFYSTLLEEIIKEVNKDKEQSS